MKVLAFSKSRLAFETRRQPRLLEHQVRIDIKYVGICGTDHRSLSGQFDAGRIGKSRVLGHEICGIVTAAPSRVDLIGQSVSLNPLKSCGECYSCLSGKYNQCRQLQIHGIDIDGGLAEQMVAPLNKVHVLPSSLSIHFGAISEPVAVACHAWERRRSRETPNCVLIFGAGFIGLTCAILARELGVAHIIIIDPVHSRRNAARFLADIMIKPQNTKKLCEIIRSNTGQNGAQLVIDAAGSETAAEQLAAVCDIGGEILQIASYWSIPRFDLWALAKKEIQLSGCRSYTAKNLNAAIQLINRKSKVFGKFLTIISLNQFACEGTAVTHPSINTKTIVSLS